MDVAERARQKGGDAYGDIQDYAHLRGSGREPDRGDEPDDGGTRASRRTGLPRHGLRENARGCRREGSQDRPDSTERLAESAPAGTRRATRR